MKKKIFVDLDDTLIDTASIKDSMFEAVVAQNVPREEVEKKYREIRESGGFSLSEFCQSFAEYDVDPGELERSLNAIFDKSEDLLLEDRLEWLGNRFPEEEYEWILLTLGDESIQERKIFALKLQSIFHRIVVVTGSKAEALKNLVEPDESFIIVDDRGNVLEEVRREFPNAEAYQAQETGSDPQLYISEEEMGREGKIR